MDHGLEVLFVAFPAGAWCVPPSAKEEEEEESGDT